MRKSRLKPLTAVIGGAFVASLASASFADVGTNPFGIQELEHGYSLVADSHEGGEGKCGEGKCGEGKCGGEAGADAGDDAAADDKAPEGKCGEGKCGEGKCGNATG